MDFLRWHRDGGVCGKLSQVGTPYLEACRLPDGLPVRGESM